MSTLRILVVVVVFFFRMAVALVPLTPPGGVFKTHTNSREVVQAALFATKTFNADYSRESAAFKAVRVTSAWKQVVSGTKYILEVLLGLTECWKNASHWVVQSCPVQDPEQTLLCKFVVIDVPWENGMDLKEVRCRWFR